MTYCHKLGSGGWCQSSAPCLPGECKYQSAYKLVLTNNTAQSGAPSESPSDFITRQVAEVERLTAENAALTKANGEWTVACAELRVRLAEADAHGKAQQRWAHEWRDKHDALTAENAALREERALIIQRAENAEAAFEGSCDMNKMILERLAAADALLAEVQSKVFIGCDLVARIDAHLARKP